MAMLEPMREALDQILPGLLRPANAAARAGCWRLMDLRSSQLRVEEPAQRKHNRLSPPSSGEQTAGQ